MDDARDRLKGLDEQEMAACLIAEGALGAVAQAWDVDKRPDHISHLWLAPNFSRRVLLWSRSDGWQNIYPYANQSRAQQN